MTATMTTEAKIAYTFRGHLLRGASIEDAAVTTARDFATALYTPGTDGWKSAKAVVLKECARLTVEAAVAMHKAAL